MLSSESLVHWNHVFLENLILKSGYEIGNVICDKDIDRPYKVDKNHIVTRNYSHNSNFYRFEKLEINNLSVDDNFFFLRSIKVYPNPARKLGKSITDIVSRLWYKSELTEIKVVGSVSIEDFITIFAHGEENHDEIFTLKDRLMECSFLQGTKVECKQEKSLHFVVF